jgi:hypothetical protein
MARIGIGQRVQVIGDELKAYKQRGTMVAACPSASRNVELDNNQESIGPAFFHHEELQEVDAAVRHMDRTRQVEVVTS